MMDTKEIRKTRALFIASFFIYFAITLVIHNEKPSIGVLCAIILGYYLLSLKYKYKVWVFDRFVSVVALLFGLSALEYILASFLVSLILTLLHFTEQYIAKTIFSRNYYYFPCLLSIGVCQISSFYRRTWTGRNVVCFYARMY